MDEPGLLQLAGGIYLKHRLKDKLIERKQYIEKYGRDMPEIRDWQWGAATARNPTTIARAPGDT
jgi:hypothetical protein